MQGDGTEGESGEGQLQFGMVTYNRIRSCQSESESELLLVTLPNDNHSSGPMIREVRP